MKHFVITLLTIAVPLLAACDRPDAPVRVGAKAFSEQQILAHAQVAILASRGIDAEIVECADTWACRDALARGTIDAMVEYTGTALRFVGAPRCEGDAIDCLNGLDTEDGWTWHTRLGFENTYRLFVRDDAGAPSDLSALATAGPMRIACPREFLRRPGDGLAALERRYGLTIDGEPRVIDDPTERYRALLEGRVDAVVGYSTDGAIDGLPLVLVEDDLGFFPRYDAAFVLRDAVTETHPDLVALGDTLADWIDEPLMRRLNYEADVEGRDPAEVARAALVEAGVLDDDDGATSGVPVRVAVDADDSLGSLSTEVLRIVRAGFIGRPATVVEVDDAMATVSDNDARIALVGAERFFVGHDRDERLEAAVVVGERYVVAITRDGVPTRTGSIGMPPAGSGARSIVAATTGLADATVEGDPASLVEAVADGRIETAYVVVSLDDTDVRMAVTEAEVQVVAPPIATSASLAVLLPARVPAGTFDGQPAAIETRAVQVVLAAVSAERASREATGGPATAMHAGGVPLRREQVNAMAAASTVAEAPHPALPSAWTPPPTAAESPVFTLARALDTALNAFAFFFLFATARLLFARRSGSATGTDG